MKRKILRAVGTAVSGALILVSAGYLHGAAEGIADAVLVCAATVLGYLGEPVKVPEVRKVESK